MKAPRRPWVLEVWELSSDSAELEWCTWSTTVEEANALKIRNKLLAKGHRARVVNSTTGAVSETKEPTVCGHCNESHLKPFDGSCLI